MDLGVVGFEGQVHLRARWVLEPCGCESQASVRTRQV